MSLYLTPSSDHFKQERRKISDREWELTFEDDRSHSKSWTFPKVLIYPDTDGNGTNTAVIGPGQSLDITYTVTVEGLGETIEFNPPQEMHLGDLELSATASSGLPVSFEVVSGPGTVSGSTLTATNLGEITVRATQEGDSQYAAAPPVERTIRTLPSLDLTVGHDLKNRLGSGIFNDTGRHQMLEVEFTQSSSNITKLVSARRISPGVAAYRFRSRTQMPARTRNASRFVVIARGRGRVDGLLRAGLFQSNLSEGGSVLFYVAFRHDGRSYINFRKKGIYPSVSGSFLISGESVANPADKDVAGLSLKAEPYQVRPKQFEKTIRRIKQQGKLFSKQTAALGVRG